MPTVPGVRGFLSFHGPFFDDVAQRTPSSKGGPALRTWTYLTGHSQINKRLSRTGSRFSISNLGFGFFSCSSLILCKDSSIREAGKLLHQASSICLNLFTTNKILSAYCYCHHSNKIGVTSINKAPHKAKAGI